MMINKSIVVGTSHTSRTCRNFVMSNEDDEANIVNYLDSEKNTDICERKLILDDKKNIATAIWPMNTELIELIKMRGNFWKSTGTIMEIFLS